MLVVTTSFRLLIQHTWIIYANRKRRLSVLLHALPKWWLSRCSDKVKILLEERQIKRLLLFFEEHKLNTF